MQYGQSEQLPTIECMHMDNNIKLYIALCITVLMLQPVSTCSECMQTVIRQLLKTVCMHSLHVETGWSIKTVIHNVD